ncbi:MAG: efflux RND transporter periplasmic adaptor subunit [Muribaculaceae bacterium]
MKKMRKMMLPAMILAVATGCNKAPTAAPAVGEYETMEVSEGSRTLYADYPASIRSEQDVEIRPQVSGLISQVNVHEGGTVHAGQVLFVIDQVPYRAAVETAEANLQNAQAAEATAELTAESNRSLYDEGVISEYELHTSLNTLAQRRAETASAQAAVVDARNNLSYTEIKSPVNGTAGMSSIRVGTLVSPTMSEPLVSVVANEYMYAYFSLTESQVIDMSTTLIGSEVELTLSNGQRYNRRGVIDAVSGVVDSSTGAVSVRARFANPEGLLRSGGSANILLPTQIDGCIVIPQEATYELQEKIFVYKVVDGIATSTAIKVLPANNGKEYIVTAGLQAGDVIIAKGAGMVREGTWVN